MIGTTKLVSLRRLLIQRACLIYRTRLSTIDVQLRLIHTHTHHVTVQLISSQFFFFFFRSLRCLFTYAFVWRRSSSRSSEFCPWEFSVKEIETSRWRMPARLLARWVTGQTHAGFVSFQMDDKFPDIWLIRRRVTNRVASRSRLRDRPRRNLFRTM